MVGGAVVLVQVKTCFYISLNLLHIGEKFMISIHIYYGITKEALGSKRGTRATRDYLKSDCLLHLTIVRCLIEFLHFCSILVNLLNEIPKSSHFSKSESTKKS